MLNSSTQNILDVAGQLALNAEKTSGTAPVGLVGDEGSRHGARRDSVTADALTETPAAQFQGTTIEELLALVASKLPDISLSEQSRLEEIEAEREGGDTAASGCNDPASDRSFA